MTYDGSTNASDGSGAVYVFTRDGTDTWSQQSYIKASNPSQGAFFFNVSLSNNGDNLLVGALQNGSPSSGVDGDQVLCCGGNSSGAAYLFSRDVGGIWSQQHFIKASNPEMTDNFGVSVSIDDSGELAIGAYNEDSQATGIDGDQGDNSADGSGAAYVFQ